ncbi:phosphatidylinositol 3,4,5-trisphosphate 5-phosphatase 1 isoform X3 [Rhinatrema bivittatum]|uniref:phosphatidylinositol 3,4,5-trisphosphate 5-phosphatase 1 isoform X3 n=1 Tax=Rhinatrema bivittatum TaxID=194408 RepID=UPI0011295202|nr:phosphatidylinositol 3,4,5-trisphosphate 5-phosphatase 1 isoform X3 [Rhinatrema bivittatum]
MVHCWYHRNITRSKAEDLLSKAGKDGSFLVRDSESISRAYALCVLYQNCVYTYRILPHEDKQLTVQASEGVPMMYFDSLEDLIEHYKKGNMGLVTHLQHTVQLEEEVPEEPEDESEPIKAPPILPPRKCTMTTLGSDGKEGQNVTESFKMAEGSKATVSETLLQRLQYLDTSSIPEEHLKAIQDYLRLHITCDSEVVQTGASSLPQLKRLLLTLCKGLHSEVSQILPTLESLQKVFDQQLSPGFRQRSQLLSEGNLTNTVSKLSQLISLLSSIEDKVKIALIDGPEVTHRRSLIPPITFEVKAEYLGIPQKMQIKVDVELGKLIIKKAKDGPDDKFYNNKKILQLIKSQKFPNKLVIVTETEKEKTQRKEYVFADSKKREGFCQLLQQMKNKHSGQPEPDMITVFIGTWNMGDAPPPKKITSWFLSKGQGKTRDDTADYIQHDIYVIGTQEDPLGEKEWVEILTRSLREITGTDFKLITIQTLWNIRIVILAKPEHENRIFHIGTNTVKTGIANRLGNKGAVGASFMFNGTYFGFVNSHLTSGSEKKLRRNQNYMNILRFLMLGDKKLSPFNITHRFTHLFWLGDLNYRVDLPTSEAENIIQKIRQQQYQELLGSDQLSIERKESKVFLHFEEEEITFPPTYRFERCTREKYVYTKQKTTGMKYNLPSWCDRILWKSYPLVHVLCQSYGCTTDIMTSDHSPVFASFEVGVTSQFVSKNNSEDTDSQGQIEFLNCIAMLKTKSQTKFYIEFHSSCLENFVKSPECENQEWSEGELVVRFGVLPKLTPIISDPEYLLDQHILISIKSSDSDESYGEGCIPLRLEATESRIPFHILLTHHGEMAGRFRGEIKLQTSEGKQREKLYDFVKIERDDAASQKQIKSCQQLEQSGSRKSKNSHLMAAEAAAIARMWGSAPSSLELQGKDESSRLPHFSSSTPTDISNPNYMGTGFQQLPTSNLPKQTSPDQHPPFWGHDQRTKQNSPLLAHSEPTSTSPSWSPVSPKKFTHTATSRVCPQNQEPLCSLDVVKSMDISPQEDPQPSEMFENPLYGLMSSKGKSNSRREQDSPNYAGKELPNIPGPATSRSSKTQETDNSKSFSKQLSPSVLNPRARSYTCSSTSMGEKTAISNVHGKPTTPMTVEASGSAKKSDKPCGPEVGLSGIHGQRRRPPLPAKSQAARDLQYSKTRDYRENSELPQQGKPRAEDAPVNRTAMM